jgi:HAMP domain-containing protein
MFESAIGDDSSGRSTLAVLAATLLIAGLGLFALRWSARRLGDG